MLRLRTHLCLHIHGPWSIGQTANYADDSQRAAISETAYVLGVNRNTVSAQLRKRAACAVEKLFISTLYTLIVDRR